MNRNPNPRLSHSLEQSSNGDTSMANKGEHADFTPVPGWTTRPRPPFRPMVGDWARLEPLDIEAHSEQLFEAYAADTKARIWRYLPYGPFPDYSTYRDFLQRTCLDRDPLFHAVIDQASGQALGVASYLRITPAHGTIEVGHICYSPRLQRTPVATDAMYLMMRRAFEELRYRRYEWKCDAANAGSRAAAQRLGFTFEGIFRQANVVKGRNRDTAWYATIDSEWPQLRGAFERWLSRDNFDSDGVQRERLSALMAGALQRSRSGNPVP